MEKLLSKAEIADILQLPPSTVALKLKDVKPAKVIGKKKLFKAPEAFKVCLSSGSPNPQVALMEARAELARAQTRTRELQNSRLEKTLVDLDEVEKYLAKMIGACNAKLLSIPTKLASQAAGSDASTLELLAKEFIIEAIDELRVKLIVEISEAAAEEENEAADDAAS